MSRLTSDTQVQFVQRARQFSQFLRMHQNRWPEAFDRLFTMPITVAKDTTARYKRWITAKNHDRRLGSSIHNSGFLRLSQSLHREGAVSWEFKHPFMQAKEQRWERCASAFRREAEEWLRMLRAQNLSYHWLTVLQFELSQLGNHLRYRGLSFDEVTYSDALAWLEKLREEKLAPRSINRRFYVVKRFYVWLVARKRIDHTPFEWFRPLRYGRVLPKLLSEREVTKLIRASKTLRNRAMLEVFYASGCRVGTLCALNVKDVSFTDRTARSIAKGGHETILYFNDSAIRAIRAYLPHRTRLLKKRSKESETALFLSEGMGARLQVCVVGDIVSKLGRGAGIETPVHPHLLRHSFATHMLNRGADVFSIMSFLGHKKIESTMRYLQVATERLSEVHRKYHPRR